MIQRRTWRNTASRADHWQQYKVRSLAMMLTPATSGRTLWAAFTILAGAPFCPAQEPKSERAWRDVKAHALKGVKVTLSEPVLVARSKGYLWFPTLHRLSDGGLLAVMSDYEDTHVKKA